MDRRKKSFVGALAVAILVIPVVVYSLSYYHTRIPTLNPLHALQGAKFMLRDLFGLNGDDRLTELEEFLAKSQADSKQFGANKLKLLAPSIDESELRKLSSEMNELESENAHNAGRLESLADGLNMEAKFFIPSSEASLHPSMHTEQRLQSYEAITSIADINNVPTKEDADVLVAQYGRESAAKSSAVPQSVLTKIESTTGISADEINRLLEQ